MARGLSNGYLEHVGRKIFPSSFIGVYPADVFPKTKRKNFSFIFNTGSSDTIGEHFVSVFVSPKKIIYFDSFGKKPRKKYIRTYLLSLNLPISYYTKVIQHDESNFCGFYCLAFLLHKYKKISKKSFNALFSKTDLKKNDTIVINFLLENMLV